jgi:hypothetical protein
MGCDVLSNITVIITQQKVSERLDVLLKFSWLHTRRFLAILYVTLTSGVGAQTGPSLFLRSHEPQNEREGYSHECEFLWIG